MTVEAYAHCDAYKFGDKGTLLFIAFFLEFVAKSSSCQLKLSFGSSLDG